MAGSVDLSFDPLAEFAGRWDTRLAERYLPVEGLEEARYECLDGRLVLRPYCGAAAVHAGFVLGVLMRSPARESGHVVYGGPLNLCFSPSDWIESDVSVLRESAEDAVWVPADKFAMPVECVTPASRGRDRIDKPALCAAAEIPYFLRVEVDHAGGRAVVTQLRLRHGGYRLLTLATSGGVFETEVPFPIRCDLAELLVS
ncbi:Uma2 family endonuclease [Streptoalloteichus hindustanus]|uniref:Putative restriction endonuclease n=1 Tax=Streptoalloteichus hindustanus TaxID=2017 RepID=A0A1M5GA68_STRHI|nr:Uma2 family endonuclease [Streptoalloteichus hindustanus]SHG00609.1 Putative restriction endonuclease [Streptoalloteichus hindustanus]